MEILCVASKCDRVFGSHCCYPLYNWDFTVNRFCHNFGDHLSFLKRHQWELARASAGHYTLDTGIQQVTRKITKAILVNLMRTVKGGHYRGTTPCIPLVIHKSP